MQTVSRCGWGNAPIYLRNTFSSCFCWNLPLITKRLLPSTLPLVPNSANRNWVTWSSCLFIFLQISLMLAKIVFLFPSLSTCGGGILYAFNRPSAARSGCWAFSKTKKRCNSKEYVRGASLDSDQTPVPAIGSPASVGETGSAFAAAATSSAPPMLIPSLASFLSKSVVSNFFDFFFFFRADKSSSPPSVPSAGASSFDLEDFFFFFVGLNSSFSPPAVPSPASMES